MDVAQLAVLRELAERGSITAVAMALHRSPSAVSQQLKTLQRQAGVVLVERVGRGVRLTDAGRALAASSVRIATAMAEAETTWAAYRGGSGGVVRVAVFPSAAELLVPGLLRRMAEHPQIDLVVEEHDLAEREFAPLVADVDIVVAHRSDDVLPVDRDDVTSVLLFREPLDLAVAIEHPHSGGGRISLADLTGERWISVPEDYPIDRVLQQLAVRTGTRPEIVYRTIHLPLVENLVAAGHGVALVPRYTSGARSAGRFRLCELADVRAGRYVEALLRPDRAARGAVAVVLECLSAEAATYR